MESHNRFTFRHRGMLLWLGVVTLVAAAISVVAPPGFWLCGVGGSLWVVGMLTHSARTGQWFTWQNWEPSWSWFEGWAAASGMILIAVPLVVDLMRAL